jgi:hypothetical protein
MVSHMPRDLTLTAAEFDALKSVDGSMMRRGMTSEIEARLLQLALVERNRWSGILCQTTAGASRVLTGR